MKTFVPILQFVLISFLVGYISMLLQREAMMEWYPALEKSSLTPPGMVFSIVWSVLYLLMGISAGLVWSTRTVYSWALILMFILQLALNLLWTFCFFYMKSPMLGFVVLVVLFMLVVLYVAGCYTQHKWSAIINIPYLLWLLFAGYLNWYVVMNN
jgi:tryptophan-rich sensory protein